MRSASRQLELLHRATGFRLLFLATLSSGLGTWLAVVALTVDVWDRTGSAKWVSALLIADFLPAVAIGAGAFVGSNSSLVAPVKVGSGAFIGSGSVITGDVPDDALALARGQQTVREGWAKRFREMKALSKPPKAS